MYQPQPSGHALPPKPVFDNFAHAQIQAPLSSVLVSPHSSLDTIPAIPGYHYSFCIQLSIPPPPRGEDTLLLTTNAKANWLHPDGCPPIPRRLPFYQNIVRDLEALCKDINERPGGCQASVTVSEPHSVIGPGSSDHSFETQRPKSDIVIGVWIAAPDSSAIEKLRSLFLARCPVALVRKHASRNPCRAPTYANVFGRERRVLTSITTCSTMPTEPPARKS